MADNDRVVVVLTRTQAKYARDQHQSLSQIRAAYDRALSGDGAKEWWACFDPLDADMPPHLLFEKSTAKDMHDALPDSYDPPRRVLVVEVPDGE